MPRTTRAQSMDALSSMGTICGYKAVLIAADTLAKNFPHADDRRRNHHAGARVSSSAPESPDCRPSPRRAAWVPWSPPTICVPRPRSRCRAWADASSNSPSKPKTPRTHADTARAQDESFYARQRELLAEWWPRAMS